MGSISPEFKHPLTILENELKLVVEKECIAFSPILNKYYRGAKKVAIIPLHLLFGQQLVSLAPFPAIACLFWRFALMFSVPVDVNELCLEMAYRSKEVLAASNNFELFIAQKLNSMYVEYVEFSFSKYLKLYMVRHDSFPYFYKKNILMFGNMIYLLTVSLTESQQFLSNTQRAATIFEMYHIPTTFSLLICSPVPSPHTTYSSLCSSLG
jgi:hypothetical protein